MLGGTLEAVMSVSRSTITGALVLSAVTLACAGPPKPVDGEEKGAKAEKASKAEPTGPEGPLDAIRTRGTLRVAADPNAAPFLSKGSDGGLEGLEYPLMRAIADRIGVKVEVVETSFSDLVPRVTSGEADIALGQLSPSEAWTGVSWSVSYLQYSLCLVVPSKSKIATIAELKGKKVAMYDDPVTRQVTDLLVSADYERVVFQDYGYFEQMVHDQLDAMVYDCPLARHEMKVYGDQLKVIDDHLNIATYNVAVPTTNEPLLAQVNMVLKELGNSGLLATLEERWLGAKGAEADYESATGKVVVVKRGESLSQIAKRELGDTEKWKVIYEANKDVVGPNANEIYTGMRLRLPKP